MAEYIINVNTVEDLQMINDLVELHQIFTRAHSTVVQGGMVILMRRNTDGSSYRVDEITTEAEVRKYKEKVFKYL
jgi:hypothetical protein